MSGHFLQVGIQKRELREHYKQLRHEMDPEEKKELDARILARVLALPEYRRAQVVLCYVSMAREVDTYGLMRAAWEDEKQVAVPRMGERGRMKFYLITNHRALVSHSFGVMEPDPKRAILLETTGADAFCAVPGLAFDRQGMRLGYGGGYYDRFLAEFPGVSAGLGYEACLVEELVREDHDRACRLVVSEARVLRPGDKEQAPD